MRNGMIRLALGALALSAVSSLSPTAQAGSVSNRVTQIQVMAGGTVFVRFGANISGRPSCATTTNEFAFDGNTAGGKALLSLLQGAQLSGKQVDAGGTGTCSLNNTRESLNNARILEL